MRAHVPRATENPPERTQPATASRASGRPRNCANEANPLGTAPVTFGVFEDRSGPAGGRGPELSVRTNPNRAASANRLSEMPCGRRTGRPRGANEPNRGRRLEWLIDTGRGRGRCGGAPKMRRPKPIATKTRPCLGSARTKPISAAGSHTRTREIDFRYRSGTAEYFESQGFHRLRGRRHPLASGEKTASFVSYEFDHPVPAAP